MLLVESRVAQAGCAQGVGGIGLGAGLEWIKLFENRGECAQE